MNPLEKYPKPPYDMVMPEEAQFWFTIISVICAGAMVLYAIWLSVREKDMVPVLIMIGGTLCVMAEPLVDIMGSCWFPIHGQWVWYESFGRAIPVYVGMAYIFYFGGMTMLTVRMFEKGLTVGQVWKWYAAMVAIEFCIEPIPIHFGLWTYYGEQPFRVFDFPLWWPPVNAVGSYVAALLIYRMRPYLKGFSLLVIIPLVPSGDLIGNAATAWPLWDSLHTTQGLFVNTLAGIATLILCAIAVQCIAVMVQSHRRADQPIAVAA